MFVIVAGVFDIIAIGWGQYKGEQQKERTRLLGQLEANSTALVNTKAQIGRLLNDDTNSTIIHDDMLTLITTLDTYNAEIGTTTGLLRQIDSDNLYISDEDKKQCVVLQQVYQLRRKQSDLWRSEAGIVLQLPSMSQDEAKSAQVKVRDMDSDINAIDSEATQMMKDAKLN